ncbi:MAG: BatD family protein [Urechidicola sp.]|nr:BatD family protein [Urechidicola sp.]
MSFKRIYILCCLLLSVAFANAQKVELVSTVSKSKLGVHQRLRIEFKVNKQGADNFQLPELKNFEVLAGPSSSISQSWVNGKVSYSQGYIFILKPKRVGEFTIPPATIEYKGDIIKSNTVRITVLNASEVPKDPNDPAYIASENVHLVTEISKDKPYVGEGIYVVYKLYFSHQVGLSGDWRQKEIPQYNGFWNQDIKLNQEAVKNTTYKGEDYRYIILKKALLIPQKSGELTIDPINMDITVNVPTGRGDFFGNAITRRVNHSTLSKPRIINVRQLPLEGKPLNFNGAVGEFDFNVSASKEELKSNETTQLNVQVSGKGNLKLFELPKIETPSELEVFTPEHTEKVRTTLSGLSGKIQDNYTIVPEFKGKYKIPEISFSYFSVKDKQYHTITSDPVIINVAEGKELPSESSTDRKTTVKQSVVAADNNFRYIHHKTSFGSIVKDDFFKSDLFYTLLFIPFLAIPLGIFIGNKKEKRDSDLQGKRLRKADKLARKYLSRAKKKLGKKEEFYIALEKALHNFLKAKLNIETTEISKERITEILQHRKVDLETIKEFIDVLNDCDFARYTPTTNVMMQQEFQKAKVIITKIDKQV